MAREGGRHPLEVQIFELLVVLRGEHRLAADERALAALLDCGALALRAALRAAMESHAAGPTRVVSSRVDGREVFYIETEAEPILDDAAVDLWNRYIIDLTSKGALDSFKIPVGPQRLEGYISSSLKVSVDTAREFIDDEAFDIVTQTIWHFDFRDHQVSTRPVGFEFLARPRTGDWSIGDLLTTLRPPPHGSADISLIRRLDSLLIGKAVQAATELPADYIKFLNVFPVSLLDDATRTEIFGTHLAEVNPMNWVLEISEQYDFAIAGFGSTTVDLHAHAFQVAIDDWGTQGGDLDKLDGAGWKWSWLKTALACANVRDRPVMRAVARAVLGNLQPGHRDAIVEGVNDLQDLMHWHCMGARYFQSYMFSRPTAVGADPVLNVNLDAPFHDHAAVARAAAEAARVQSKDDEEALRRRLAR